MTDTLSIVFSCWTRSLDLVGRFLDAQKIRFARIDGSLSLSERQKMLADFESEPSISVLIMTTGTGATGYIHTSFTKHGPFFIGISN